MIEQADVPVPVPWHAGEIEMQRSIGVAERMAVQGPRVVRDFLPEQHRNFYAQLPFVVVGSVDPEGDVWAAILVGRPGFMTAPEPRLLVLEPCRHPMIRRRLGSRRAAL